MRRSTATAAVLASVLVAASAGAITFGVPDEGLHPNVGAIFLDEAGPVCSGTLIHPRVFLTAGHCTVFFQSLLDADLVEEVSVSFEEDPSGPGIHKATEVLTHPEFAGPGDSFSADAHDVGLLVFDKAVMYLEPAALAPLGFLDSLRDDGALQGALFTVVGYGATLSWPPPLISPGDARQRALSEFRNLRNPWLQMSQVNAPGTEDGGTCFGDSGGPTFATDAAGEELLVAVTSWGDVNCVATGVAYRTDVPGSRDFIDDVIGGLGEKGRKR